MTNKSRGFTLPEMLISISLGLFLSILLIKIYLWQYDLHHQMDDMIFLDRHGILILNILGSAIRSAESIKIQKFEKGNKIIINKNQVAYYPKNNGFYIKKKDDIELALSSDVKNLRAMRKFGAINITLDLIAPHGLQATLYENIKPENEKN